jgi:methyltransferase
MPLLALVLLAFGPMLLEARLSARHERALRAGGALEPSDDVFTAMQFAYPSCFEAMLAEAWVQGLAPWGAAAIGAVVFAVAKGLKYWAIASLGRRWTFRVLVPPASTPVETGPYRFLRHPNYVGVMGELIGFALLAGSTLAGLVSVLGFGALIFARIRVEERALGLRAD